MRMGCIWVWQAAVRSYSGVALPLANMASHLTVVPMRHFYLLLCASLAMAFSCHAQVQVELELEKQQYLSKEDLVVGVKITNLSGQTLHLGEDDDWLSFLVDDEQTGRPAPRESDVPVKKPFALESSKVGTRYVNIAPYYQLQPQGRYKITAIVKLKEWSERLESPGKTIEIIKGSTLWTTTYGVPPKAGQQGAAPDMRKYLLQKVVTLKQMQLYVSITDAESDLSYKVLMLGPMVSFSRPEAQLDKLSNLHVLCQSGSKWFFYAVVSPEGNLALRQTYYMGNSRPLLKSDGEGGIRVSGGNYQPASSDYPAPTNAVPVYTLPSIGSTNTAAVKPGTKGSKGSKK